MRSFHFLLSAVIVGLSTSLSAGAPDYQFDGRVSRGVLENFLARAVTFSEFLHGQGNVTDNIRFLTNTGAKFVGRAIYRWGGEAGLPQLLERAKPIARQAHEADSQFILQAACFEIVTTEVDQLPAPNWVFEAFGQPVETRHFRYDAMLYPDGKRKNHWAPGASVPDMSQLETQLWFLYLAAAYIDLGVEAIHFGQVEIMDDRDPDHVHWLRMLKQVRAYAATHARRYLVLCDAHVPSGGLVHDGQLMFDFHSFPLRIDEVPDQPLKGVLKMGYLDSLFGRSKGGRTPSGWDCRQLPYLVELDNFEPSGREGQNIGAHWIWGYDEISWFAHLPIDDRNAWLRYAWKWIREHDQAGWLQMPGSRTLSGPVEGKHWYWANTRSAAVPDGFSQEETIKEIWSQAAGATTSSRESAVRSTWEHFERLDFKIDNYPAWVVFPKAPAPGDPWIWRTEFFGHQPQADLTLLSNGFHVAYLDVQNLYGAPPALDRMDRFYTEVTQTYNLSKKVALEGLSRGGLFALNWAARHPERVSCLYLDAPVCDFKSWPGGLGKGKGSPSDWARCKSVYNLNEAEARAYALNPVDNLAPLAAAHVPILSVCGDADDVVPFPENTGLIQERYQKLGGPITVIIKPGVGHHPHSLQDPTRIVEFVLRAHSGIPLKPSEATTTILLPASPESVEARLPWWREARFGLFIHWGPSSVSGKEISWARQGHPFDHPGHESIPPDTYDRLYEQFNPEKFDAEAWMRLTKEAGMKYVVFITKHHDGFSMWPTQLRKDYSIAATPFRRDICREISDAAHRHGLKLGWYYSTRDWTHPDYLKDGNSRYNDFYHGQVRELLTNYGRVDLLWFDHVAGNWRDYRFQELFEMVFQLQPGILINDRAAKFIRATEDQPSSYLANLVSGDFETPEQRVGKFQSDRPWESCVTITECSDGGGWSYRPDGRTRTFPECVRMLVSCVTGDGNLLLNVGPLPTGEIDPQQVTVLKQMGSWLRQYGESVYGTRGGPFRNGDWGGATYKDKTIYLHVFPGREGALMLPALKAKVLKARALTGGETSVQLSEGKMNLTLPAFSQEQVETIIRLDLDAPAVQEFVNGQPR